MLPLLAALAALAPVQARDTMPAPLEVEPLLTAPTLAAYSPPAFSPDGRWLAYVVTDNARRREVADSVLHRTGVPWYGVAGDVWLADLVTGASRRLTDGRGSAWGPGWSPDGRRLAFLAAGGSDGGAPGPAGLWTWEPGGGEPRPVRGARVLEGHHGLPWTAGGSSVVVAVPPSDLSPRAFARLLGPGAGDPHGGDAGGVRVFTSDPEGPERAPATEQVSLDLWRRDVARVSADGGGAEPLLEGARVFAWAVDPSGRRIAYAVFADPRPDDVPGQHRFDLRIQDLPPRGPAPEPRTVAPEVRLDLIAMDGSLAWSPTGDALAWRTGGPAARDEVHVLDLAGGAPRRVAEGPPSAELPVPVARPVWGPEGRAVWFVREGALWRAAADGSGADERARLPGHALSLVAPRLQRLWSPDGGRTAVVATFAPATKRAGFARVDLASGAVTPLVEEDRVHGGYGTEPTVAPRGDRLAWVAEDATHPPDLWVAGPSFRAPRRVTDVAPALAGAALGRAEVIAWQGAGGDTLRGALVYPAGYEAGRRYPLVVKVYGGSDVSDQLNRFGHAIAPVENVQLLASRGYAVLLADSRLEVGAPVDGLAASVLPGVDRVVAMGVADPGRIGVTGHSYGGYAALALLTRSPRFRAAVVRAGFADLAGMYGQLADDGSNYGLAWAESGQGRMGGSPWEVPERYRDNSPFWALDRVEAAVLLVHGGADDAVPPHLADQVFTALRRLGKTVTYARYPGEGHWEGGWSLPHQVDALRRSLDWFDRYLAPGTGPGEPASTTPGATPRPSGPAAASPTPVRR